MNENTKQIVELMNVTLGEKKTSAIMREYDEIVEYISDRMVHSDSVKLRNSAIDGITYELLDYTLRILGVVLDNEN